MENNELTIINEVTGEVMDAKDAINLDYGEAMAHIQIRTKTINQKDSKDSFKVFSASAQFMLYKNSTEPTDLIKKYLYKEVKDLDSEILKEINADIEAYNNKDNFYLVSSDPVSIWVELKFIKDVEFSKECNITNTQKLRTGEITCKVKDIDLPLNYKVTLIITDKGKLEYNYPTCWVKRIEGFKPFYSAMPNRFNYAKKKREEPTEEAETTE